MTFSQTITDPNRLLKSPPPEDGFYPGTSEIEYRNWDAVSFTRMKLFKKSPQHVWAYMTQPPESKPAQELGSAIHMASLEPKRFEEEYFAAPGGDRRTKGVKEAWANALEDNPGRIGLNPKDWDTCRGIRDSIWTRHDYAAALLGGEGFNECSYVWTDPATSLRCKARVDRATMTPEGYSALVDLKSIQEASEHRMEFAIRDFGYHIQGAHCIEGLEVLIPVPRLWKLIFCEKDRPWAVRVREVGVASMELGKRERHRYLSQYKRCLETGRWPAYEQGCKVIDVPDWEFRAEEKREEEEEGIVQ